MQEKMLKNEVYDVKIFWKGWIDCSKGSPGAGLFNIHTSGGWAEMAGNHPCTNIGGQTFNRKLPEERVLHPL